MELICIRLNFRLDFGTAKNEHCKESKSFEAFRFCLSELRISKGNKKFYSLLCNVRILYHREKIGGIGFLLWGSTDFRYSSELENVGM